MFKRSFFTSILLVTTLVQSASLSDSELAPKSLISLNTQQTNNPGSTPRDWTMLSNGAAFIASDDIEGDEVFVTDGSAGGTRRITGSDYDGDSVKKLRKLGQRLLVEKSAGLWADEYATSELFVVDPETGSETELAGPWSSFDGLVDVFGPFGNHWLIRSWNGNIYIHEEGSDHIELVPSGTIYSWGAAAQLNDSLYLLDPSSNFDQHSRTYTLKKYNASSSEFAPLATHAITNQNCIFFAGELKIYGLVGNKLIFGCPDSSSHDSYVLLSFDLISGTVNEVFKRLGVPGSSYPINPSGPILMSDNKVFRKGSRFVGNGVYAEYLLASDGDAESTTVAIDLQVINAGLVPMAKRQNDIYFLGITSGWMMKASLIDGAMTSIATIETEKSVPTTGDTFNRTPFFVWRDTLVLPGVPKCTAECNEHSQPVFLFNMATNQVRTISGLGEGQAELGFEFFALNKETDSLYSTFGAASAQGAEPWKIDLQTAQATTLGDLARGVRTSDGFVSLQAVTDKTSSWLVETYSSRHIVFADGTLQNTKIFDIPEFSSFLGKSNDSVYISRHDTNDINISFIDASHQQWQSFASWNLADGPYIYSFNPIAAKALVVGRKDGVDGLWSVSSGKPALLHEIPFTGIGEKILTADDGWFVWWGNQLSHFNTRFEETSLSLAGGSTYGRMYQGHFTWGGKLFALADFEDSSGSSTELIEWEPGLEYKRLGSFNVVNDRMEQIGPYFLFFSSSTDATTSLNIVDMKTSAVREINDLPFSQWANFFVFDEMVFAYTSSEIESSITTDIWKENPGSGKFEAYHSVPVHVTTKPVVAGGYIFMTAGELLALNLETKSAFQVGDIYQGSGPSRPSNLVVINDKLTFSAKSQEKGLSLWTINAPATAVDDAFSMTAGTTAEFDILANDTDPDDDNETLRINIDSQPGVGVASVTNQGKLRYQAPADSAGTAELSYFVLDSAGTRSNKATVRISISEPEESSGGGGGFSVNALALVLLAILVRSVRRRTQMKFSCGKLRL